MSSQRFHEFARVPAVGNVNVGVAADAELEARGVKERERARIRSTLLIVGIILSVLALAITLQEAFLHESMSAESDGHSPRTLYAGIWLGASFASLSAFLIIFLFKTNDSDDVKYIGLLWANQIFGVISTMVHIGLLVFYYQYTVTFAYQTLKENGSNNLVDNVNTQAVATIGTNLYLPSDSHFQIYYFLVSCGSKVSTAAMLVLCDVLHVLIPLVIRGAKFARCQERSAEALPAVAVSIVNEDDYITTINPTPTSAPAAATGAPLGSQMSLATLPTTGPNPNAQLESQTATAQQVVVNASLFELAKQTSFFATLQVAFGISFKQDVVFDSALPHSSLKITCKKQRDGTSVGQLSLSALCRDENQNTLTALTTLRRFVHNYVPSHSTVINVRFPIRIRDEPHEAASVRIRESVDAALGSMNVPYIQLAYDADRAQIDILCATNDEAVVNCIKYVAHRRMRTLVYDLPNLFDLRREVHVFKLRGATRVQCRVLVYQGEVWRVPADFLVNSIGDTVTYDGMEGLALEVHRAAGQQLRAELETVNRKLGGRKLNVGEVVCTNGCKLPAALILHVHSPNANLKPFAKGDDFKIRLQQTFAAIFDEACVQSPPQANDLKLAVSLISSGLFRGGRNMEECFDPLLNAIMNASNCALQRFSEIHIVDRCDEKIEKLRARIVYHFKQQFERVTQAESVSLVRVGFQPFEYAGYEKPPLRADKYFTASSNTQRDSDIRTPLSASRSTLQVYMPPPETSSHADSQSLKAAED